jgi:hypothetical protein
MGIDETMRVEEGLFDGDALADDQPLFRYLSFSKLMNLLTTQTLYLPRIDQFRDPLEGRFTSEDLKYLAKPQSGASSKRRHEDFAEIRRKAYASCWAMQARESDAHWRLYCADDECVAIVTTARKIQNAFRTWSSDWPNATYGLGRVRYVDHLRDEMASEQGADGYRKKLLRVFALKNDSFRWEEEARVVVLPRNAQWKDGEEPRGIETPIDASELIERLIVSPASQRWFRDTVVDCVTKYGLGDRVILSELATLYQALEA